MGVLDPAANATTAVCAEQQGARRLGTDQLRSELRFARRIAQTLVVPSDPVRDRDKSPKKVDMRKVGYTV